jgi:hypothetical protein
MQEDEDLDRFTEVLAATVKSVVNEPVLLGRLEPHFSPKPASLAPHDSDEKELQQRVGRLIARLGGATELDNQRKRRTEAALRRIPGRSNARGGKHVSSHPTVCNSRTDVLDRVSLTSRET